MLKGVWCKCCIHGDHFVRVARVPGKPGSPGKTGFLKLLPRKPWKEYNFQDDFPGKPGKKYSVIKAQKFALYTAACMYLCNLLFSLMMKNGLLQLISSSMKC